MLFRTLKRCPPSFLSTTTIRKLWADLERLITLASNISLTTSSTNFLLWIGVRYYFNLFLASIFIWTVRVRPNSLSKLAISSLLFYIRPIFFQYSSRELSLGVECSPLIRETWVQSQIISYKRSLKWYLISPYITLSNIRYVSRVKWSNPGKGVVPSPTSLCRSY